MTPWYTIENDGPPDDGVRVKVRRSNWIGDIVVSKGWGIWIFRHGKLAEKINRILSTDRWTPIVPPDPPKPED